MASISNVYGLLGVHTSSHRWLIKATRCRYECHPRTRPSCSKSLRLHLDDVTSAGRRMLPGTTVNRSSTLLQHWMLRGNASVQITSELFVQGGTNKHFHKVISSKYKFIQFPLNGGRWDFSAYSKNGESKRKTYLPPEDFSQMAGFASAAALFAKRSLTH